MTLCALYSARSWAPVSAHLPGHKGLRQGGRHGGNLRRRYPKFVPSQIRSSCLGLVVVQIVNFINDTILTLLLMLMMLGTREGCVLLHKRPQPCWPALADGAVGCRRTPEQVERERTNPHSMSVMERIEASIRNYILLKVRDHNLPAALLTSSP